MKDTGNDQKSAVQAKFDAQKIVFGPIMFQAARALRDLGILDHLKNSGEAGATAESVSLDLNLKEYSVKILLEAALSMELVYTRNEAYHLTKTGWYILTDPLTRVNMDFTHDVNYLGFFQLTESLITDTPAGLRVFGNWNTIYEGLSSLPPQVQKSWFAFDHYYSDNAFPEVIRHLRKHHPGKILDVGGNTGRFAVFCASNLDQTEITILDHPGQAEKAIKNVRDRGLCDRIKTVSANLLDHSTRFPAGYDIVWMSQFLDCFPPEDIVSLLERAGDALSPEGSVLILETLRDRQKYEAASYSLHATSLYFSCMANGCSKMYDSAEMESFITRAGLRIENEIDDIGLGHTLICCIRENGEDY